jgi:hypothetical protein
MTNPTMAGNRHFRFMLEGSQRLDLIAASPSHPTSFAEMAAHQGTSDKTQAAVPTVLNEQKMHQVNTGIFLLMSTTQQKCSKLFFLWHRQTFYVITGLKIEDLL